MACARPWAGLVALTSFGAAAAPSGALIGFTKVSDLAWSSGLLNWWPGRACLRGPSSVVAGACPPSMPRIGRPAAAPRASGRAPESGRIHAEQRAWPGALLSQRWIASTSGASLPGCRWFGVLGTRLHGIGRFPPLGPLHLALAWSLLLASCLLPFP